MSISLEQSPKQVALQMVAQMIGISEEQRSGIREIVLRIPEEQALDAVKMISETQGEISSAIKQGEIDLQKATNRMIEEISREDEENILEELENELNAIEDTTKVKTENLKTKDISEAPKESPFLIIIITFLIIVLLLFLGWKLGYFSLFNF